MDIESKIKEVHDYFKNKIVSGDFTEKNIDSYRMSILVDGKYPFTVWIANGDYGIGTCNSFCDENFMTIKFNAKDKKILWGKIKARISERVLDIEKAEYERLKNKYENKKL